MEIDGNVEFLGSFKEGPISCIIVELLPVVIVIQGSNKTELLDTTRQFICSGIGVQHGHCRPAPEARRNGCR